MSRISFKSMKALSSGGFLKNIVVLASGTALSQVVNFLFIPLIARIYGPEAYGVLGYYSALITFITPLAALCYPLAIVLPKSDIEAKRLFQLSMKLACYILIAVGIFCLISGYATWINWPFSAAVFLLPLGSIFSFIAALYAQYCIRIGRYKLISTAAIFVAVVGGLLKITLGRISPAGEMLIGITIAASFFQVCIFAYGTKLYPSLSSFAFSRRDRCLLRKYSRFPRYRLPHTLVAALSQLLPIFLLTSLFGARTAGFYALTRAALSAPVNLIGKAIYDVSYPTLNKRFVGNKANYLFVRNLTSLLAILSLIPLIIISLEGPRIFVTIFGPDWGSAGTYAAWMIWWFSFNLFNKPCAAAVSVYGLDGFLFKNGILNVCLSAFGFFLGFWIWRNDVAAIALFSISGVVCQIILIVYVLTKIRSLEHSTTAGGGGE